MFLDLRPDRSWGGDPICKGCKMPIAPSETSEWLQFTDDNDRRLDCLGLYHADCAAPLKSIIRALECLRAATTFR